MDQATSTLIAAMIAAAASMVSIWLSKLVNTKQAAIEDQLEADRKTIEHVREALLDADRELRTVRLGAYVKLWAKLRDLKKDPPAPLPSGEKLRRIRDELVDWYYQVGGLVMTKHTQHMCFVLRDLLKQLQDDDMTIEAYEDLFDVASALRTHTTIDVYSRRTPALSHEDDPERRKAAEKVEEIAGRHCVTLPEGWGY
jgi:hypothetical protein